MKQRHELDLSQRELAELCGLPQSSITRIESGKTSPNLSTLLKILRKLGLRFSINSVLNPVRY
ncbi:helix-turn-helix domain-containing protein [Succinivibrio sp.]|uniref:helix-turn-helix domain-containing protein n=1 Tax=Succinivibrio sp. TaxID=2053619 RepID=UPI00345CEE49